MAKEKTGKTVADFLDICSEWDVKRNIMPANEVSIGSNKKYWWKCSLGHEWKTEPYRRQRGDGCPYCSNRRVLKGFNDFATKNPDLLKEWDYSKNEIMPDSVVPGSIKRVFWICSQCGNSWETALREKAIRGCGCPECGKRIRSSNRHNTELKSRGSLSDPNLLQDFDYEANYPKTPKDFTPKADTKVFWRCHVCGYKWSAKILNRANGRGCPACSNKVVFKGHNDFATTHPLLAKEWNFERNGSLQPSDVTFGYGKKVWWTCPNGHEYQATVNKRTSGFGTNCPICASGEQTSFAEQAVFYYLKKAFPDAINRYHADFLGQMELDIYIPSWKIGIEYDGMAWHKEKQKPREFKKYKLCHEHGIKLIRLKESPIQESDRGSYDYALHFENMYEQKILEAMIFELYSMITHSSFNIPFTINIERDKFEIMKYRRVLKHNSFESKFPEIAKEWHPTKNGSLKPSMFLPGSDHKVWWLCPVCGCEYMTSFSHRKDGTGCPNCSLSKFSHSRCRKINMLDAKTGSFIKGFPSASEAARELNINPSNITSVCRGNRPQAGGYRWEYQEQEK